MNIEATKQTTDEIEVLRLIIQSEQNTPISYDEALEIGESLVSYFKALADEENDEPEGV